MKIYVVVSSNYDYHVLHEAFTDKQKADESAKSGNDLRGEKPAINSMYYEVHEVELNA